MSERQKKFNAEGTEHWEAGRRDRREIKLLRPEGRCYSFGTTGRFSAEKMSEDGREDTGGGGG